MPSEHTQLVHWQFCLSITVRAGSQQIHNSLVSEDLEAMNGLCKEKAWMQIGNTYHLQHTSVCYAPKLNEKENHRTKLQAFRLSSNNNPVSLKSFKIFPFFLFFTVPLVLEENIID